MDIAHQLADALLGHVVQRLTDLGAKPHKAFVCGEGRIPSDEECCKGLAWTRVATIFPTDGSAAQSRALQLPGEAVLGHAIKLEVGVMRCAPVFAKSGQAWRAPKAAELTASAVEIARDRDAMRRALECEFTADIARLNCDGQVIDGWYPVRDATCTGGWITTNVVQTISF